MRVLFVTNLFPPIALGGFEIECCQIADGLAARGHDVSVLTSDFGWAPNSQEQVSYPVRRALSLCLPFGVPARSRMRLERWRADRHNFAAMLESIRSFNPNLIYFWSPLRLGVAPARAAASKNIPVAWRIGDENLAGFVTASFKPSTTGVYNWFCDRFAFAQLTLAGLRFDHVSCVSRTTKTNLLAHGVPIEHAHVIYKGIPLDQFPTKAYPGSLSAPMRLLYVGQVYALKGVHTLIDAAHRVAGQIDAPLHLTIVGTGPQDYQEMLHAKARTGKAKVSFTGKIPYGELSAIYRSHDILVFPSIGPEGFGATHHEAMCSGLPVISTAGGGQREFLLHEDNALVFPEGDVEALSACIFRLIRDEHLRLKLARSGRRLVEEKFSLIGYVKATERFLESTLSSSYP